MSLVHSNQARLHRSKLSNGHLRYKTVLQLLNLPQNIKQEISPVLLHFLVFVVLCCSEELTSILIPAVKAKWKYFPFPHY